MDNYAIFLVSRSSDGEREWFSARDPAAGVVIPAESRDYAYALVSSLNRAFSHHARQLLSEADKREKVARDREAELVGMIAAADESRLLQIRRAEAARNVALDDAAAIVDAVSHEGLHNSMWRCRFERVAADIRAMKSEGI